MQARPHPTRSPRPLNRYRQAALGAVVTAAVVLALGCATQPSAEDLDAQAAQAVRTSFRTEGIASVDRLNQDLANEACSKAQGAALPEALTRVIEAANLKTVKAPANAVYLGDWKEGEKLAQSGRGLTYSDDVSTPNGGNCYNCHQISKQEISFGTIGPSLLNYGKLRGISDPAAAASLPIVEYTWGKLWNARAYNACSNMPRFGHMGILNEAQIRDIMALLLDPKSPVNQ